jgi:hypothetical protein
LDAGKSSSAKGTGQPNRDDQKERHPDKSISFWISPLGYPREREMGVCEIAVYGKSRHLSGSPIKVRNRGKAGAQYLEEHEELTKPLRSHE